jgi:2-dehydropantoate 2-reductase
MLQDLQAGRPTEIESINGTMLQMANSVGLSLDTHQTVYELVSSLEKATLAK